MNTASVCEFWSRSKIWSYESDGVPTGERKQGAFGRKKGSVVVGSKTLLVFRLLPTTHAKVNAKQMRSRSLRAARLLACYYFHAQPAVHAINLRNWRTTIIFITGKSPIWAPCRDQDGAWSGVSLLYICGLCRPFQIAVGKERCGNHMHTYCKLFASNGMQWHFSI